MSMVPTPPERCGHVAPMVIERAEGGYVVALPQVRDCWAGAGK